MLEMIHLEHDRAPPGRFRRQGRSFSSRQASPFLKARLRRSNQKNDRLTSKLFLPKGCPQGQPFFDPGASIQLELQSILGEIISVILHDLDLR